MSIVKANKFQTLVGDTYSVPIQVVTSSLGASNLGTTLTSTSDQTNSNASYVIATTSTTWTDTTNLQLTITPKFSTSLIKLGLSVFLYSGGNANGAGIRVRRGTTIIFRPAINNTGPYGTGYFTSSDANLHHFFEFYDYPATTSAVTYTLQYRAYASSSTVKLFGANTATDYAPANWFTATEIAQ